MDKDRISLLLKAVASGEVSIEEACEALKRLPYSDLDFAKVDLHRALRQGMAEVIYCPGKTPEQVVKIARELKQADSLVIATRATEELSAQVIPQLPGANYNKTARMIFWGDAREAKPGNQTVAILTGGTADMPVAEEAAAFLSYTGYRVERVYDVGVAGIHRLLSNLDVMFNAAVLIVVAGMDGALASVVAGVVAAPVIAVPTSVGYGSNFEGLSALLSMLNSCAVGLTVVNIDSGFAAASAAIRILSCRPAAGSSGK